VRFVGFEVAAKVTMSVRILSVIDAGTVLVAHLLLRCHLEDQFHSKWIFFFFAFDGARSNGRGVFIHFACGPLRRL
jgi:hypothetical protein